MRLARFTLEDHAYGTSRLPKTTILQSTPNSEIEETEPLVSLRLGTGHFACVSRRKISLRSILLPNFFVSESLLYFGEGRNIVALSMAKIRLSTPIKRVVFSVCSRFYNRFETHSKSLHGRSNNQNTLPPLPPNRYVTKPFSQRTVEAEEKEPGNEVVKMEFLHRRDKQKDDSIQPRSHVEPHSQVNEPPKIWKKTRKQEVKLGSN